MSDSQRSPMLRSRMVAHDSRYQSAPPLKCSALDPAHRASLVVLTLEVHPGHKGVHTAATLARECNALGGAAINVATPRANWAAIAIWPKRIAVPAAVTDQRNVRLVHARCFNQIEPCVMRELQARLWWQ